MRDDIHSTLHTPDYHHKASLPSLSPVIIAAIGSVCFTGRVSQLSHALSTPTCSRYISMEMTVCAGVNVPFSKMRPPRTKTVRR